MDVKIQAERDRLLSDANVARLRGDFQAMEAFCRKVIGLTGEDAVIVELLGDALHGQGKIAEARDCFHKSAELQPGRASTEIKYARAVLELADSERQLRTVMEDLEHPGTGYRQKRRVAGSALLSIIFPGLGQLMSGEYVKGGIVLGTFLISLLGIALLPDTREFARQIFGIFGMSSVGADTTTRSGIGPLFILLLLAAVSCYVYSIMDAFVEAAKGLAGQSKVNSAPQAPAGNKDHSRSESPL